MYRGTLVHLYSVYKGGVFRRLRNSCAPDGIAGAAAFRAPLLHDEIEASGSLLFFGLLFLSSLILGRAFCGWICPGGAAQKICLLVNDRRVRRRRFDWIKYVIWVPWLATILFFLIRSGAGSGPCSVGRHYA